VNRDGGHATYSPVRGCWAQGSVPARAFSWADPFHFFLSKLFSYLFLGIASVTDSEILSEAHSTQITMSINTKQHLEDLILSKKKPGRPNLQQRSASPTTNPNSTSISTKSHHNRLNFGINPQQQQRLPDFIAACNGVRGEGLSEYPWW
jgi:hypothetical protein